MSVCPFLRVQNSRLVSFTYFRYKSSLQLIVCNDFDLYLSILLFQGAFNSFPRLGHSIRLKHKKHEPRGVFQSIVGKSANPMKPWSVISKFVPSVTILILTIYVISNYWNKSAPFTFTFPYERGDNVLKCLFHNTYYYGNTNFCILIFLLVPSDTKTGYWRIYHASMDIFCPNKIVLCYCKIMQGNTIFKHHSTYFLLPFAFMR